MLHGMSFLPDADSLVRLASHISGHADEMRRRADDLAAAAERVAWRSTAADAFRARARDLAADLRHAASGVDDAAHSLRSHAANVRHAESIVNDVAKPLCRAVAIVEAIL
jgi:methyl-accepting chemotaxis protein